MNLSYRPRRLRRTEALRRLVAETRPKPEALILPLFVTDGVGIKKPIESLPGHFHLSVDQTLRLAEEAARAGIGGLLFFGLPPYKDACGSSAWQEDGPVQRALAAVKAHFPQLVLISDVCLCEYTSHGHCGCLDGHGSVDNDKTLPLLARTAVSHALAGADVVAPSDMMDGRVAVIRQALDEAGFEDRALFSYAVKYASACYGPFRLAADSAPQQGDRKGYQMDHHNSREALRELALDIDEGADAAIIKPGLPYLDVLQACRQAFDLPLLSYWVSGEYAQIKAAEEKGWIDGPRLTMEMATCFFRAGADMLITYSALDLARWAREGLWW